MTLRYKLFGRPGNLDEVTDLLKSKQARRIDVKLIQFEEVINKCGFKCDYIIQTPKGEFIFKYYFPKINNMLKLFIQGYGRPYTRKAVLEQLSQQKEEFTKLGIECSLE